MGRTVNCIDGAAAITTYLTGVASGSNRPAVIVYPGNDVGNAIDSSEETAISASASAIATYVANGGGILGHTGPYAWLTTLLPGITILRACTVTGAALTPTGQAAFPTITNADITSGPCHNTFGGNIGSLQVLARDGNNAQFILGGGATTVIAPTPPEPPMMIGPAWAVIGTARAAANTMLVNIFRMNYPSMKRLRCDGNLLQTLSYSGFFPSSFIPSSFAMSTLPIKDLTSFISMPCASTSIMNRLPTTI